MRISLNKDWEFRFNKDADESLLVTVPHTVKETPFNSFDESIYQTVCSYRKTVTIPEEARGKRLVLHVDGAAHQATIFVNDKEQYVHKCGYTAFDVDITEAAGIIGCGEAVAPDGSCGSVDIRIELDTRETLNQPPFGNVIDYMTYGGIYREIWLDVKNEVYIKSAYHHYIEEDNKQYLDSTFTIEGLGGQNVDGKGAGRRDQEVYITQTVRALGGEHDGEVAATCELILDATTAETSNEAIRNSTSLFTLRTELNNITRWDIDNPVLYEVTTTLSINGEQVDEYDTNVGFRMIDWRSDGFYLNGRKVKIRGVNRHQSYAYVGYAMPASVQVQDVMTIKHELGMNAVRTSHYPQSREFIDACDREGLLVFTEIPGWQHIGDDDWKDLAVENVRDMITWYRNHPSIILWGVRINESMDDDEFYTKTNALAHELAPGIFTGGVRFLQQSHLLEDVYTYNDFLHNGKTKGASPKSEVTPDMSKAYMVSEFNGHMFPTKPYDDELHRIEHALRHATVLNEIYRQQDIAGCFGWCLFDYNTHQDFGSGDRICYHGLTDMFRNPKFAAGLYRSQSDEEPVLEVASDMNIGEYPGGDFRQVYLFTNMDSVKLYKNGVFIKEFYPDKTRFESLPHPPVIVDDFVGELLISKEGYSRELSDRVKKLLMAVREHGMNALPLKYKLLMARMMMFDHMTVKKGFDLYGKYVGGWGDRVKIYEFVGFKDGREVMRVKRSPSETIHLDIKCSGTNLKFGDTYDAAAVRIRVLNQNGSVETYINEAIEFEASGSIEVMGPCIATLRGGMGGTYVRTTGAGEGTLTIRFRDEVKDIKFNVTEV